MIFKNKLFKNHENLFKKNFFKNNIHIMINFNMLSKA